ncbi:hypothetical protein I308_105474 [Cryptococcus tetragattii IND107]|uniref:Calpain catalytic domain-containing protein n=1 Tax=Cryptococcus tetragattii IND107 TaxID=1296105 RepID=A0ABR3BM20_9TREE|nr:hypothetical protein I308_03612 [Cryptococcus tetragattii IND107]
MSSEAITTLSCDCSPGARNYTLEIGHPRCTVIKIIQDKLLRARLLSTDGVCEDREVFGDRTMEAIRRYEEVEWLVVSRVVAQSTWQALLGMEDVGPILHTSGTITPRPQPDNSTCWAACLASMLDLSVDCVIFHTPVSVLIEGALKNNSETHVLQNIPAIPGSKHGLVTFYPQGWLTGPLADLALAGPIMLNTLLEPDIYSRGYGSAGHCLLIVGVRGRREPDGKQLILRVWDPLPSRRGTLYSITYYDLMNRNPLTTFRITVRETSYRAWGGSGGEFLARYYPL